MSVSRKFSRVKPQEEKRHEIGKFICAIAMKIRIAVEDRYGSNIATLVLDI